MRVLSLLLFAPAFAANLMLVDVSDSTVDGGTYGTLVLTRCANVTVRNCGFGANQGTVANIQNSSGILLEACTIDGQVDACTGLEIGGGSHHVTVRGCHIHDIADDGVSVHSVDNIFFYGNTIEHLYGCGTDGGCGPCYNGHSDGIELFSVDTCVISGNLIYDVTSTGAIFSSMWATRNSEWTVTNNIFYTPKTGIVAYFQQTDGLKIYNNIVWGSLWQGLSLGEGLTRLEVKNNILQNINYTHMDAVYDPAEHDIDYNLLADNDTKYGYTPNTHDIEDSTHRFTVIPEEAADHLPFAEHVDINDFAPLAENRTIDAGWSDTDIPVRDILDHYRTDVDSVPDTGSGIVGYYDMGALEFGSTSGIRGTNAILRESAVSVRPNPSDGNSAVNFIISRSSETSRRDVSTHNKIAIYSATGDLVFFTRINDGLLQWDGCDNTGRMVDAGIYFYTVTTEKGLYHGHIMRME